MSKDRSKARKEGYFIQAAAVDGTPYFTDVSSELGRPMQFTKPLATAAMRVTSDAVIISAMKVTQSQREKLLKEPLSLPQGPLARLERRLAAIDTPLAPGTMLVEYDGTVYPFTFKVDANGITSLDYAEGTDELAFELPRTSLQLTIFMPGPKDRTVVVGWSGYQQKPGNPETLLRAASYVLNHLTSLAEFAVITRVHQVRVPAPPGRFTVVRPARKAADEVNVTIGVRLWTDDAVALPVASGNVKVHINLENANPLVGRLLLDLTPDEQLAPHFDAYRQSLDHAIQGSMLEFMGQDEITDIVCDIALGEVSTGTVERLREEISKIIGYDLKTRQAVPFPTEIPA